MAFDYFVKIYKHWRLYSEFTQIVTQMEDEHLFNEKQSIRDSAKSLKKYGSTCNHIRNNDILIRHEIDKNDTLQGIALKYGCTTEQIRRANRLFASDSLFLRQYLMIPIERNSPYYLKDDRPHSLPTQRAASITGYYTTVLPTDTNTSSQIGQTPDNDQPQNNSKSVEFVTSSSSPMSPEEENKRSIDEFLCKIDTTLAETKKYVAKSKNSDFSQSDNDLVAATSFTDGTNRHSSGNINHNNYYYQQEQSYNNNHYSAGNHKRNNSSGNCSNTSNNEPQHLIVMTQGKRIQNSLQRLEKQQDEFFEL